MQKHRDFFIVSLKVEERMVFMNTIKGGCMDKFIFSVPTTIFFGEGQARAFAEAVKAVAARPREI